MHEEPSLSGKEICMRFILRLIGYALVVVAFVTGMLDATRSLANGALSMKPLGQSLFELLAERYLLLQPAIERHVSKGLWDYVILPLTLWPTSLVALGAGIALVLIGHWRRKADREDDAYDGQQAVKGR
jgi:hypothetical protein